MLATARKGLVESLQNNLEVEGRSLWQDAWRRFLNNRAAIASLFVLGFIALFVLVAPMLSSYAYDEPDWGAMHAPPSWESGHYFGTDALGRDLFVRAALGGRISLLVGILGTLVAVLIGTAYGAIAGYIGGNLDRLMMRWVEILDSMPFMFFVIVLVTIFGRNFLLIFVAIGAVSWTGMARVVRGQTLSLKNKEFVEATHVYGLPRLQVISRHIVPNVLGLVAIYATILVPGMILFESFLSFLGLGVQEPMTSWGALLNEGAQTMEVAVWQLVVPATMMVTTLFCFNFIGDGLRDALDPKDR
ncbi:oligopeptide ABC transporter permease OppC [Biformimicrobium ophioploci]|uniref:Oligopeptide transport system permease protein OppC n=1 Tax=Biformimicrobium ophioploci TaxID=3036711 RepID=A0ABQ6LZL9_9GAMM|nr:oligopeptide ABC transporter permease OppC [Microbulbifer sp. NKW57]GMG87543.1 oligopeptide ABC transporter permease OppC [Microbulbifer sp. NKW57]